MPMCNKLYTIFPNPVEKIVSLEIKHFTKC